MTTPLKQKENIKNTLLEAFRQKYEGANTGGAISSRQMDAMIEDIRLELAEFIKSVQPDMPYEVKDFVDDYDDYTTGIMDAKNKLLVSLQKEKG